MRKLRLLLITLLTGVALVVPPPGSAEAKPYYILIFQKPRVEGHPIKLHLRVALDGSTHVSGFVDLGLGRFVAHPNGFAEATCSDQDGDGVAGLTSLVASLFSTGQEREQALLAMRSGNTDIDETGTYQMELSIGGRTTLLEVEVESGSQEDAARAC